MSTTAKNVRKNRSKEAQRPRTAGSSPPGSGVRFLAYIRAMALELKGVRNSEKTKLRLMASALDLLEQVGFRDLNVDDVVKLAGLAKGTFYIHFPSKDDFLIALARRYLEFEQATVPMRPAKDTPFRQLREWVAWYERTFELNVGIIRCLVQMGEVSNEMRSLWHQRNAGMVDRIVANWYPVSTSSEPAIARLALRLTGGMLDQSLFERYQVQIGPGREDPNNPEMFNELHSLLLYRALYGANPPEEELAHTHSLLKWPA